MSEDHIGARKAVTWDQLKNELFDDDDRVEIERRAVELRAQIRRWPFVSRHLGLGG